MKVRKNCKHRAKKGLLFLITTEYKKENWEKITVYREVDIHIERGHGFICINPDLIFTDRIDAYTFIDKMKGK